MAFLRVVRDRRGYETTYLMELHRDGHRQRSRILYVFRTPGSVRVGRVPLQPETLRLIEERYGHIVFDWKAVLSGCQVIESGPDPRRPRTRKRAEQTEEEMLPSAVAEADGTSSVAEPSGVPHAAIPPLIEGGTAEEQSTFLALWYPIIRDRILRYTGDPARREALLSLADRLNPEAWEDADQVASGLQQAAEALERLSLVLTKRRRRRPPPRTPEPVGEQAQASGAIATPPLDSSLPEV